ncbi:capsular biosynthesis protein [Paenibacillus darwinianus]|uniref:non-specific protein-tyrosine kinase n=1 Tax=Paenibacillus darwinianus TaxID=1380763 RepID=A0A9W5S3M8_9BACL|nr:CpsD/CapB family tyrosine-protein kinase [Paenibacillus darwinianus]EXX91444.1 capsular biosynthesis protein [Paenibacillus darwinianus]
MSSSTRSYPLITERNPKSPISEAYKILRTNIQFSNLDVDIQTIMVTSTAMGEGKSTTSANLAVTYAQAGRKVLIIDADLRKPTQHHILRVSNRVGLTSVLSHQCQLDAVLLDTTMDHLSIIPSGPIPPNPSEILASKRMNGLLEDLKSRFDIIIIDTPPVLAVTDAQIMAAQSDGVLMVVDSGKVKKDAALRAKASLDMVGAKLIGVVLNNISRSRSEGYYTYNYGSHK